MNRDETRKKMHSLWFRGARVGQGSKSAFATHNVMTDVVTVLTQKAGVDENIDKAIFYESIESMLDAGWRIC